MKISLLSVFPELYDSWLRTSLVSRAQKEGRVEINCVRFSDLCAPKERIDEPICGPGVGMIIKPEVIERGIKQCEERFGPGFKIFFSPQGTLLTQRLLRNFVKKITKVPGASQETPSGHTNGQQALSSIHLILICSRYEGVDARVLEEYGDAIISIGDYVVMGGDLPAQVFLEAFLRLIPGVVGKEESVLEDSFESAFLDYPHYGLPVEWKAKSVPPILLSGNHAAIKTWREEQATQETLHKRFDWFSSFPLTKEQKERGAASIPSHYVALMHGEVILKGNIEGATSVTSIDIHDSARSCMTYGIKNLFMVSPLQDQHMIMETFIDFWRSEVGRRYNQTRFNALSRLRLEKTFDEVVAAITKQEGVAPLVIATSAQKHEGVAPIDYRSQGKVWSEKRPVLILFGTGQGLSNSLLSRCDYLLLPVTGLTDYNHLSVRSAIAVVLDRWLGVSPVLDT